MKFIFILIYLIKKLLSQCIQPCLNVRIQLGVLDTWYMTSDLSSEGDLIIESFNYNITSVPKERYFYGLKSNGRPLFYKESSGYTNQKILISNTEYFKFESQLIRLRLSTEDEKDYFLSSSFSNCSLEIIDFYNNKITAIPNGLIFGYNYWNSVYFNILNLKHEEKTYMFCFIGNDDIDTNYYLSLQKLKFFNTDISQNNSYELIKKKELTIHNSYILTCIEISKYNIIQCFYINNTGYYTVGLFNEDTLDLITTIIVDDTPVNATENERVLQFHQCINLKDEISILGYMINSENTKYIYLEIKKLVYNVKYLRYELEDYLIRFNKYIIYRENVFIFDCSFYMNHLKKINDNKFSIISSSKDRYNMYIALFDIYNFRDTNLFIRYYNINMTDYDLVLFQVLTSINFNGFLGVIYTTIHFSKKSVFQYFSLFGYINNTDSSIISLKENHKLILSDYLNNNLIQNNFFGFELYGIKIIKLPKSFDIGVYFFSKLNNNKIFENDILSQEDEIYFIYDYNNLKIGNTIYTIEFAGIVKESNVSTFR